MQPETIGRYEILEPLGRGGQATVYRGYDPVMQREVAVKVLPAALAAEDAQARERFEREAHTIAALEHPAIVPVYDFGAYEDGLYIVMRLMKGGTLADRLAKGAMNPADVLKVLRNVASALDAAHKRGIVHRDIKPGNILFDEYGTAYLSDFGIARLNTASSSLTGSLIVGTPHYMSPEQINGGDLDGRSDVYALGALLFQMLTGHVPYEAETPAQAIIKHLQEPVPDIAQYRPDLPEGYQDIIERAMAKDREARYPTAGALVNDLEAIIQGKPLADENTLRSIAPPTVKTPRPEKEATKPPRKGWLFGVVALLVVGALAAVGVTRSGMFAPSPTATPLPSATALPTATVMVVVPPTATPQPTATPAPTATQPPEPTATFTPVPTATPSFMATGRVIGGTDLIAFVGGGDIWFLNFEGNLKRMTTDGGNKHGLQWLTPTQLLYINGSCVFLLSAENPEPQPVLCFNGINSLDAFRVTPDGKTVAIVLDNELYITTFDIGALAEYRTPDLLPQMPGFCARFVQDEVHEVLWSENGTRLAARVTVPIGNGRVGDQIEILNPVCGEGVYRQHTFPGHRFPLTTYAQSPRISSFDWDGDKQFVFTLYWRNGGFGDMYLYSRSTYIGEQLKPLGEKVCCYGVPHWSPDGSYLFFAYQDINDLDGHIDLYYVPAGTIGAGVTYKPLTLPEYPFKSAREQPEAAMRPLP